MVVPDPGVDFFVSFNDLNPNAQKQCIYFVKADRSDRRCRWDCSESDNRRAIELHPIIAQNESEDKLVDHIRDYIQSNCCSRAKHRDVILSSPLLIPLVERWLDEIQVKKDLGRTSRPSADSSAPTTPKRTSRSSSSVPSSCNTSPSSATSRATTVETPLSSPSHTPFARSEWPIISPNSSRLEASSAPLLCVSPMIIPDNAPFEAEPLGTNNRYYFRSRAVSDSLTQLSKRVELSISAEFTPHIHDPTPEDTVAWKICEDLNVRNPKRDLETGMVYMYSRRSSPGYVKIGWTARSVDERLAQWSECGYTPIELFRATGVPYAQRVETLTHYELIKEWRREQPCKGCLKNKGKSVRHQEWFEVNQNRAIQILSTWVELFKKANPYELSGSLKSDWREVVNGMKKNNETVTSKKLLEHYEATVAKASVRIKETVKAEGVMFVKERSDAKQRADANEEMVKNERMVIEKEIVVKEEEITAELSTQ
ncbi:hypothetical protein AA0117_g10132 [Alternaria alternata]|jgi:hypothetical protein|uniref:Bacteriophage T5 Orf172 DNA-binding domain-containing protein n=1 Tax=Alternaria alternata TaxID=5599 RepID=A0A4Q4N733_ALTAL|nr:uncharacterized protein J4E82_009526 [Alternaria postmessia]KAI5371787.1 hypothetical protein J4E82_009526 [Alternaria postmessia]RYN70861.1 hypothetical protein AA0117_g10132 [Alternaria alternata]